MMAAASKWMEQTTYFRSGGLGAHEVTPRKAYKGKKVNIKVTDKMEFNKPL
jgi:hypothetical protein